MGKKSQEGEKKTKHLGILIGICVVAVLAVTYVGLAIFFNSHFCFGTTLDGIKVGGKSAAAAEELIKKEIDGYSLTLLEREGKSEVISGSSIAVEPVFGGEVEKLIENQNGFSWIVTLFRGEEFEMDRVVTYDNEALKEVIQTLSCMKTENQREPVNATYSAYEEGKGYSLVPADYGTAVNEEGLLKAIAEAVNVLADELDMDETGCYEEPQVGDEDEKLLALIDTLNSYTGMKITYDFGENTEVLDGQTISTWLSDDNLEIVVDSEEVLAFVKTLAKKYNTAYEPKTLKTSYGQTVTISGGHYGWRIDNGGEVDQILLDLEGGSDVEREPVYLQTANSHGENDYGDSYVEINLTAQHLFVYKDGELIVESDFVSGNLSKGYDTPTGAFALTYKTKDATLRGDDYATPVNYWMPFAGNVGMHDATWRRNFGGGIYKKSGSHGCINLPLSAAEKIYNTIDKGYAVLVYNLPGTESKSVLEAEANDVINTINAIGTVTLESETIINNARSMYDALSSDAKKYVTNYDVLVAAEATLAQLKAGQPAAEVPVQETPAQETPAQEAPVEETPVQEAPAQ